jgi:hypothetical protein
VSKYLLTSFRKSESVVVSIALHYYVHIRVQIYAHKSPSASFCDKNLS